MSVWVQYRGQRYDVPAEGSLTFGREADVMIDDNPYLHRVFLTLASENEIAWLRNVGDRIPATVSDAGGLTQVWLAPGGQIPLVFPCTTVWFTAGPHTYSFEVFLARSPMQASPTLPVATTQDTTLGTQRFTPDQLRLVVVLAESMLRVGPGGKGEIPSSTEAARRLGWTVTKFNRKLDNVCEKLTRIGVTGLVGEAGNNASSRRTRLVEYAVATRLVTTGDLVLLDPSARPPVGPIAGG